MFDVGYIDGGPNNQSMTSLSSSNSVIIPGEKAYQMDQRMHMKQQLQQQMQANIASNSTNANYIGSGVYSSSNQGHRTSKSQSATIAHQIG